MDMTIEFSEEQQVRLVALSELEGVTLHEAAVLAIEETYTHRAGKYEA
jgi:hypothetical protein